MISLIFETLTITSLVGHFSRKISLCNCRFYLFIYLKKKHALKSCVWTAEVVSEVTWFFTTDRSFSSALKTKGRSGRIQIWTSHRSDFRQCYEHK